MLTVRDITISLLLQTVKQPFNSRTNYVLKMYWKKTSQERETTNVMCWENQSVVSVTTSDCFTASHHLCMLEMRFWIFCWGMACHFSSNPVRNSTQVPEGTWHACILDCSCSQMYSVGFSSILEMPFSSKNSVTSHARCGCLPWRRLTKPWLMIRQNDNAVQHFVANFSSQDDTRPFYTCLGSSLRTGTQL